MDWIRYLGRFTMTVIRNLGAPGVFLAKALFWTFAPPFKFSRLIKQLEFIGVKSTFIVLLTGAFTGMVLGIQGYYSLNKFGAEALLGPAVALSLIRELGPVISALMVTGRAGSALTAEIGIMRISEQIDALEIMALSPFRYLIVPNLLAGIISLPLLGSIFNVVGIYGGYLVGVNLLGLNEGAYFGEMQNYVDMQDILDGLTKSFCFGVIISWICCYKGYTTGYGAAGVSKATTQAVVAASVFILIWDYFLTSVMF